MKKKKSKDYLKGFQHGAYWAMQWFDMQTRNIEADLEETLYEMKGG